MPPHVGRQLAARRLLRADEPRGEVGDALDGVLVEEVRAGRADVDEDRVVLGRPPVAGPAAEVVGPDDLVEERVAAEHLVEQQLDVVRLAVVDVQVQRAARREQPAGLVQQRLEHAEVVVVDVEVARARRARWWRSAGPGNRCGRRPRRGRSRSVRRCCALPVLNGGSM